MVGRVLPIIRVRKEAPIRAQSLEEERANAITHGLGIVLSLVGMAALSAKAVASADPWRIISYPIFGLTMILLYTASTLYHSHEEGETKSRLKVFDHIAIYYLIAGTYTPVTLVGLGGTWGWSIFGVVWGLALAGSIFKMRFIGRFPVISTALYVAMGWIAAIAVVPLVHSLARVTLLWLLAGGLCYTGGVVFYAWQRLRFHHAVWHLLVLAGTACHFVAVMSM